MIALVVSLVLLGPLPDAEAPNPFLAQAKELYEQLDFEKCMQRIKQASAWKGSSVKDLRDIELFGGLCALNLGNRPEAAERFKLALRIDEDLELPEFASPKAVKLFLYVKKKLRQPTVAPLPDEDLPPDAPAAKDTAPAKVDKTDKVLEVTSPSALSKHVGSLVMGIGAIAIVGVGVGLGVNAKSLEMQAKASTFESDYLAARAQSQTNAIGANIAFAVAGVLAVAAIIVFFMRQ